MTSSSPPGNRGAVNWMLAVAITTLTLTVIVGFGKVIHMLSQMEIKLDLTWQWYLDNHTDERVGGRRRTDPPAP